MYAKIRAVVRSHTPDILAPEFAGAENYLRRLKAWGHVIWYVRGAAPRDVWTLWRSILAAPITSLAQLRKWREPYLMADAEVLLRGLGRFTVRAYSDDLGHVLAFSRERVLFNTLRDSVGPGDVVLDAGANIGVITMVLARCVGPTGRVIAVEMMPDTAARLRRHIAMNGLENVEVIEKALSSESNRSVMATVPRGFFGQASIVRNGGPSDGASVSVQTTTIDALTVDIPSIALMKMDLEGAEPQALLGAERSLEKIRSIVFESWSGGENLNGTLSEKGFLISTIDGRNLLARRSKI
ncbi:MAG: FkbM family methyltransferase [Methylocystis silviterrae]|uniref:FkbM family methyltransferase n=1 Tax=Methylocystis silviterrae TaxID=2743612 RepID=UPI003C736A3C